MALAGMEQLLEESAEGRSKVRKPRPGDNPSLSPAAPGQPLWALLRSDWEAGWRLGAAQQHGTPCHQG